MCCLVTSWLTFPLVNNGFMICDCYRWENDVVDMVEQKHGKQKISVSFECDTLKADNAAEEHIKTYMPNLVGFDAVGRHLT